MESGVTWTWQLPNLLLYDLHWTLCTARNLRRHRLVHTPGTVHAPSWTPLSPWGMRRLSTRGNCVTPGVNGGYPSGSVCTIMPDGYTTRVQIRLWSFASLFVRGHTQFNQLLLKSLHHLPSISRFLRVQLAFTRLFLQGIWKRCVSCTFFLPRIFLSGKWPFIS